MVSTDTTSRHLDVSDEFARLMRASNCRTLLNSGIIVEKMTAQSALIELRKRHLGNNRTRRGERVVLKKYNYTARLGSPGHRCSALSPLADESRIPDDGVLLTAFCRRIRRALRSLVFRVGHGHRDVSFEYAGFAGKKGATMHPLI